MDYILKSFPVNSDEYEQLHKYFGDLAHYAAWQLVKKNVRNNLTDDPEDISQEILCASIQAASYFKRQVYLESCMHACEKHIKDSTMRRILHELIDLWKNRTKHGANKQKFGEHQEHMLETLVDKFVPITDQPRKDKPLEITSKFVTYCKAVLWNRQKSLGKKITREKAIRSGIVSLSEYDYLVSTDGQISAVQKSGVM